MPALPWTAGPDVELAERDGDTASTALVFASRLTLRRWRDVPAFLRASLRIRAAAASTPGCLGVSLDARIARRTFSTLSTWADDDALAVFARHPVHLEEMRRWRPALRAQRFARWHGAPTPTWAEARQHLDAA